MKMDIDLQYYLQKYFQYDSFNYGQREIIEDVMRNKDVLGILPTGSGKSICYQLPALIKEGTTIVITPLISLMIDQVRELKAKQIREVVAINSFMSWQERREVYDNLAQYKIIYISPELIQQEQLLNRLKQIQVSLFVIDEAHCLSQWGHEFRTDYLRLKEVIAELGDPPLLALTATATKQVQEDILTIINRPMAERHVFSIDRSNIIFHIQAVKTEEEKIEQLVQIIDKYQVPTLIYFSSRQKTEEIAQELARRLPHLTTSFYHGGMESIDRLTIQQQFMNEQLDVICCTSAFGMGINKKNIRLVIHYHFPADLESYVQEIGRAGRDGKQSLGVILYSLEDQALQRYMINRRFPEEQSILLIKQLLIDHLGMEFDKVKPTLFQMLEEDEIHLQFLQYHFEKNDIIINNRLNNDIMAIERGFHEIRLHIEKRRDIKSNKLIDMINFLQTEHCLRSALFNYFHSDYKKVELCCTNCGFSLQDFQPEIFKPIPAEKTEHWQEKLNELFLIGE